MKRQPPRALLDTNIVLSYAIAGGNEKSSVEAIMDAAFAGRFQLLISDELIAEILLKLTTKAYFIERVDPTFTIQVISRIRQLAETIPQLSSVISAVTPDSKDDYLIAYAVTGSADYLVSGDKDLLVLADTLAPLRIRSPRAFLEELTASSSDPP